MKTCYLYLIILLFSISFSDVIKAQETEDEKNPLEEIIKKGFKIPLSEDGRYFTKMGFGTQIWSRYMELNPGATSPAGDAISNDFDILLRRNYMSVFSSLDRITLFAMFAMESQNTHVSTNPFNPYKKSTSFFFYDAFGSYQFHKKHLTMGMGLNMYNGISRYSSASSSSTISADVPLVAVPDLLTTNQGARQMSVFATGKFGKLDYRLALANPFVASTIPVADTAVNTAYEYPKHGISFKGYFNLQLWDQESNVLPFYTSSYLGSKKIFNIGVGFDYNPESCISFDENGERTLHNRLHVAADVFVEYPFKNQSVLTAYASYFLFDYGPNYYLSYGVQDICNRGLAEPQHGTGSAIHTQLAYILPKDFLSFDGKLQFYHMLTYKDFDALNDLAIHHDIGITYYLAGHNVKWTLEYQNRPYFGSSQNLESRKSMIIGKFQIQI
jgi:hypothetical protein